MKLKGENPQNPHLVLWNKKIDKPIAILTSKKREETQFAKVRNEGEDITVDSMDMQGKIKEYCIMKRCMVIHLIS